MAGIFTELGVAGRLAGRSLLRRLRAEVSAPPDLQAFTRGMQQLLDQATPASVGNYAWLTLPATQAPWFPGNFVLQAGDAVSYFVEGRVYANRFLDIYLNPALQLWCKVGAQGEIFRGTRNSHSFVAQSGGELTFGNYFPNDWADAQGQRKQSDAVYQSLGGELKILMIRWNGSAAEGLQQLLAHGDYQGRIQAELQRIEQGDTTPPGWHYLWHLGPGEIYRQQQDAHGQACIHCHTHADVGILQKDVDLPLTAHSEISWRWCINQLPSTLREDAVPSHDYLSLAVEFDNGRDITYYWSSTLPEGTGYDCPLPNWKGIEYHVVVRSGQAGLGQWLDERRNLHDDYRKYMGEPPARITRVWLIANSIFQRGTGDCAYAQIRLHSAAGDTSVL
ncbi:Protein of unknown function [Pseudomonas pohangensis]|uniref:DUF3047 domain-containing protein n=1 Tax=Pseudomonas pohangensis TaxID=364197 RepID=A0A1H2F3I9_9PSED|nr:DUF3047 domain-containing protein [Pseudomonas pohangensis]SDU01833.1 Protein of unknown function [Pseudomonas pohangensis]